MWGRLHTLRNDAFLFPRSGSGSLCACCKPGATWMAGWTRAREASCLTFVIFRIQHYRMSSLASIVLTVAFQPKDLCVQSALPAPYLANQNRWFMLVQVSPFVTAISMQQPSNWNAKVQIASAMESMHHKSKEVLYFSIVGLTRWPEVCAWNLYSNRQSVKRRNINTASAYL